MRTVAPSEDLEWLEADGLGGYASGTACGLRTRRYHAVLTAAADPPSRRVVLVNGFDAWVVRGGRVTPLTAQRYAPGVVNPAGAGDAVSFTGDPWPTWRFDLGDAVLEHALVVPRGKPRTVLTWRLTGASADATLYVRPFFSGRGHHALHRANPAFRFEPERRGGVLEWRPYDHLPAVAVASSGSYTHAPDWYRSFLYEEERRRGLDCTEDLAAPGVFAFDLAAGTAALVLTARGGALPSCGGGVDAASDTGAVHDRERRRRAALGGRLARAADAYLVRGARASVVAGYPWFADWGRDTFVSLRGLCLATGRLDDAAAILQSWRDSLSAGMLPNRFPDDGGEPEYTSVDAALWFVAAAHATAAAADAAGAPLPRSFRRALADAVQSIVGAYAGGTRHGIRMDGDALLASGEPGLQLTWMDARVGGRPVTPRHGKPVEVQALWLNALSAAAEAQDAWAPLLRHGLAAFRQRFPNPAGGLFDVVDGGGAGGTDAAVRPNQILAVGGLPFPLLEGDAAAAVVETVEKVLLTPLGLRTLAPGSPVYRGRYEGGPGERDAAYHQGTAWPWLLGPFAEAWVRVRGRSAGVVSEARGRFLAPLLAHLDSAGLGHVSEIADGDAPHTPRGCPFQAWSVGEALRLQQLFENGGTG